MRRWWRRQWRLAVLKRHCKVVNTRAAHRKKTPSAKTRTTAFKRYTHTRTQILWPAGVCAGWLCVCGMGHVCARVRRIRNHHFAPLCEWKSLAFRLVRSFSLALVVSSWPPGPQDPCTPWPPSPIGYRRRKLKIRIRSTWRPFVGNRNGEKLQKTPRCG